MKTYEVNFNDFGTVYVFAESYKEAEAKFLASGDGGSEVTIRSIVFLGKGIIKLTRKQ